MTFAALMPSERLMAAIELAGRIGVWLVLLAPCALVALMAMGFKAAKPRSTRR